MGGVTVAESEDAGHVCRDGLISAERLPAPVAESRVASASQLALRVRE
jgi:hypothetical protein